MMTFETTTEMYRYAKEHHRNVCSCYINYPNPKHKSRSGKWICVDDYEPCDNYGFKKMLKKQYCLRCKKGEENDKC